MRADGLIGLKGGRLNIPNRNRLKQVANLIQPTSTRSLIR
jgi:hypothetical protein